MKVSHHPALLVTSCLVLVLAPGALAQNDECATATSIGFGAGFTFPFDSTSATDSVEPWSCSSVAGRDLWFEYTASGNDQVDFSACSPNFGTVVEIFDGQSCSSLVSLGCSQNACGAPGAITLNVTSGQSYLLRVGGLNGGSGAGQIVVQFTPPPNDQCAGALQLLDGLTLFDTTHALTHQAGWACGTGFKDIWYTFISTSNFLDIRACGSSFDPIVELFDGSCGSLTPLACASQGCGISNGISLQVLQGTIFYLRVGGLVGDGGPGVLDVSGAGPILLGSSYCVANPNSTGAGAALSASGSSWISADSFELTASSVPTNTFGFFMTSRLQGFFPNVNGSQGNLCLSGPIGRYVGAGEIQNSGALREFRLALDLSRTPTPTGFVGVLPGDNWNFQAWFRDASSTGVGSNFTNGLSVQFL